MELPNCIIPNPLFTDFEQIHNYQSLPTVHISEFFNVKDAGLDSGFLLWSDYVAFMAQNSDDLRRLTTPDPEQAKLKFAALAYHHLHRTSALLRAIKFPETMSDNDLIGRIDGHIQQRLEAFHLLSHLPAYRIMTTFHLVAFTQEMFYDFLTEYGDENAFRSYIETFGISYRAMHYLCEGA